MASQRTLQAPQTLNNIAWGLELQLCEYSLEALRGLDKTLLELRLSVSHRLNETRPINRLPPEVLGHIFEHVRAQKPTPSIPPDVSYHMLPLSVADIEPPPAPDMHSLISVTHVCRQWRATALASPGLWVDVVATSAPAARTFVERAGSMPIRVHVAIMGSKLSRSQKKALWYLLPHIRGLILRLRYRAELSLFKKILSKLATSIVDLGVLVCSPDPSQQQGRWMPMFRDGYRLFGRDACALKSLAIISPEQLVLNDRCPNLRALRIHQPATSAQSVPLTRFLSHTSDLEELVFLSPKVLKTRSPVNGVNARIRLPRLSRIHIHLPLNTTLTALEASVVSSICSLRVQSGLVGDFGQLGYTVRGRLEREAADHAVELTSHGSLEEIGSMARRSNGNPRRYFAIVPWYADHVKSLRITRQCFSEYNMSGSVYAFLTPLGSMPALEMLVVRVTSYDAVFADLCFKLEHPSQYYPYLHTVILSILRPSFPLEDLHSLFRATALRATALGKPLQRLIICSPARRTKPDNSMYDSFGVDCITFSDSDAGSSSPGSMWTRWSAPDLTRDTRLDPNGDEPIWGPGNLTYDQAWAECASRDHGPSELSGTGNAEAPRALDSVRSDKREGGIAWEVVGELVLLLLLCYTALVHGV